MAPAALVTGATGFIGRHLVERLARSGCRVRAFARDPEKFRRLFGAMDGVELVRGDFSAAAPLAGALPGVSWVFHLAGATKARRGADFDQANHLGSRRLYETIRDTPNQVESIIHVSSLAAVGPSPSPVPPEAIEPPRPLTRYGRSKLKGEAEALALAGRFRVVIIRPPAVFGPGDFDVLHFLKAVARGVIPIMGDDRKRVSLVYAGDLARGLIQAARSNCPSGSSYFLAYDETYRWSELGQLVARLLRRSCRTVRIPMPLLSLVALSAQTWGWLCRRPTILNLEKIREIRQPYWVCSPAPARRDFGFEPEMDLEHAMAETIRWYQENGHLPR